jgi:hypothetical protein
MSYQSLQTLSQIAIAIGSFVAIAGGFGTYFYGKKAEEEKEQSKIVRPIIDICHRGISVEQIDDSSAYFDIPYCAGKNANAFNVQLQTAVVQIFDGNYRMISDFSEEFPAGISLTYETGKSISYKLSPFTRDMMGSLYICVKGNYTNEQESRVYNVADIFKFNSITSQWVRTLNEEDKNIRKYLKDNSFF